MPLPPSLYAATAKPGSDAPALDGTAKADVVVVGGGFTGLSTALHLAERGADVRLIEAREPGWGASGRNGGQVNPGLKVDPDTIAATFAPERARRMIEFAWGAARQTFEFIARHSIACEARNSGTLRAAYHPGHAEAVRRSAEQSARHGSPVTLLEGDDLRQATGTGRYLVALRDATGGDLQPLDYARGLARVAVAAGATIHGHTPALALRREGSRWQVTTPTGVIAADQVVLATNGYTDGLFPGLGRSIVPAFSSIIASVPLPDSLRSTIMPSRSVLYESGNVTVYLRVDGAGRLLMGGRGPQRPIGRPADVGYLMDYARKLWPALGDIAWQYGWNGQLAMTTDHYPHLQRLAPGLTACLGYNGRGVALSTCMGRELAALVTGGRAEDAPIPVTDLKTIPLHGLWRLAVAAKVAQGRVLDLVGR